MFPQTVQQVKRWLKIVSGFTLLAVGIVMLVTPGPGWLVIIAGLALLAAEYVWAQRLLQRMKDGGTRLRNAVMPPYRKTVETPASAALGATSASTELGVSTLTPRVDTPSRTSSIVKN